MRYQIEVKKIAGKGDWRPDSKSSTSATVVDYQGFVYDSQANGAIVFSSELVPSRQEARTACNDWIGVNSR